MSLLRVSLVMMISVCRLIQRLLLCFLLLFVGVFNSASASEADTFKPAKPVFRAPAIYPASMRSNVRSGMVELSIMVGTDGEVYSPAVIRSSDKGFERAALRAALKYKFNPATLGTVPVDSHFGLTVIFQMIGYQNGSGLVFRKAYKSFKTEFKKPSPNRKKLDKHLKKMRNAWNMSEYSIAYLSVAESMYAEMFGSLHQQLEAFKKLQMYDRLAGAKGSLLGVETMSQVKAKIVRLELQLGNLQDAIYRYAELSLVSPELAKRFQTSIEKAQETLSSGAPFTRKIDLSNRGSQELTLNAAKFSIFQDTEGISKLIFRCQSGYSSLLFTPDSEYLVPKKWGVCKLQLEGKANTTAVLHQYK